ncbi:MAG: hypothetical protein HYW24_03930 [Candidatus Aenigmarchaeota archaeon]|nr:hypothetical protein [Candidatus Aenigmarchaeota archaeon]
MPQIYLIGTNHRDLKGGERLSRALELLQPHYLVLESSREFAINTLDFHYQLAGMSKDEMKDSIVINGIKVDEITDAGLDAYLRTFGYEIIVGSSYALVTGAKIATPLLPPKEDLQRRMEVENKVGMTRFTDETREGAGWPQILRATSEDLEEHQRHVEDTYRSSRSWSELSEFWDFYEGLLVDATRQMPGNTAVIVGQDHIFTERSDLYTRLNDLKPRRFRLSDFDRPIIIT